MPGSHVEASSSVLQNPCCRSIILRSHMREQHRTLALRENRRCDSIPRKQPRRERRATATRPPGVVRSAKIGGAGPRPSVAYGHGSPRSRRAACRVRVSFAPAPSWLAFMPVAHTVGGSRRIEVPRARSVVRPGHDERVPRRHRLSTKWAAPHDPGRRPRTVGAAMLVRRAVRGHRSL
jgi:hypothetical protein